MQLPEDAEGAHPGRGNAVRGVVFRRRGRCLSRAVHQLPRFRAATAGGLHGTSCGLADARILAGTETAARGRRGARDTAVPAESLGPGQWQLTARYAVAGCI